MIHTKLDPPDIEIPSWIFSQHINWMEGYANRPRLHILVEKDLPDLSSLPIWRQEGRAWVGRSPDGRIGIHYHGGLTTKLEDGTRCTAQGEGYGGQHFPITLQSGEHVVLRGPWHGGPPPGTAEVTHHHTCSHPYKEPAANEPAWFHCQGFFGWYISSKLYGALIIRAGYHLYNVTMDSRTQLEPGYSDGPKGVSKHISTKGMGPEFNPPKS